MATKTHRAAANARKAAAAGDTQTLRAALAEERRGYVTRGATDRVKQVDAQLKALDDTAKTSEAKSTASAPAPRGSVKSRTAEQD